MRLLTVLFPYDLPLFLWEIWVRNLLIFEQSQRLEAAFHILQYVLPVRRSEPFADISFQFFALAQAVYPALFALYPTYEKLHKVRAVQYSNGVRALPLWISYTTFDFIFVLVVSMACTAIVAAQAPTWFGAGYLFPVLLL
jgi:hypothetical protein